MFSVALLKPTKPIRHTQIQQRKKGDEEKLI